jgi:hypothetical protein
LLDGTYTNPLNGNGDPPTQEEEELMETNQAKTSRVL